MHKKKEALFRRHKSATAVHLGRYDSIRKIQKYVTRTRTCSLRSATGILTPNRPYAAFALLHASLSEKMKMPLTTPHPKRIPGTR